MIIGRQKKGLVELTFTELAFHSSLLESGGHTLGQQGTD